MTRSWVQKIAKTVLLFVVIKFDRTSNQTNIQLTFNIVVKFAKFIDNAHSKQIIK